MSADMDSENNTILGAEVSQVEVFKSFEDMNIPDPLLRGLYAYGFEKPSAIQMRGIVPIAQGRDVLAQAQSGTGKTGTFTIGSMCRIDPTLPQVQVLVLVPTHELAKQNYNVATKIGTYLGIKAHYAIGGKQARPVRDDIDALRNGCQFLIGTPGRIYDLCHRGALRRDHIKVVIMDEADQMLEDRFQEQVMEILKLGFPQQTRIVLFSATFPADIVKFTDGLLTDPVRILIQPNEVPLDGIAQYYVPLDNEDWKFDVLCDIYSQLQINQAIIYCNKRSRAEWLCMKMREAKFPLDVIYGEMPPEEREQKMEDFVQGRTRVLIGTDLISRGIDVQTVSLVINFELPTNHASYIHRIGRAGRYGRKGTTINLLGPNEMRVKDSIEKYYNLTMENLPNNLGALQL